MSADDAFKRVRIILCESTHAGNIGATARAMKNMGLGRLYLVSPKQPVDKGSYALAAGAGDLLDDATVVDTLDEALQGVVSAIALTSRRRELTPESVDCHTGAARAYELSKNGAEIAVVFGPERNGLTKADVRKCNLLIGIPADEKYPSLNLSHAVQIFAYEFRRASEKLEIRSEKKLGNLVTADEMKHFIVSVRELLKQIGFLDKFRSEKTMIRFQRLLERAKLSKKELNLLYGMVKMLKNSLVSSTRFKKFTE